MVHFLNISGQRVFFKSEEGKKRSLGKNRPSSGRSQKKIVSICLQFSFSRCKLKMILLFQAVSQTLQKEKKR
jgi:hypothetical protein